MPQPELQLSREIDGLQVESTLLGYNESDPLLVEMTKKAAPLLGLVFQPGFAEQKVQEAFAPMLVAFSASMSREDWAYIRNTLLTNVTVQTVVDDKPKRLEMRKPENRNTVFTGRNLTAMKVLLFSLEHNFGDFYEPLARLFQKVATEATETAPASPIG